MGCANVCMEMGKEEREERERLAKVIEEGAKMRNEMIEQGRERKRSREAEMEQVKVALEEKRVIKDAAEAPEKEALNKIKEEEERLKKLREEEEKLEREKEALEIFDKLDSNQDGQLTKDELTTEIRFDQNNDGMVNEEEAEFYMSGNESYQRDSFIDNGWPLMKPALSDEEVADNTDSSDSKPEFNDDEDDHVDTDIDDEEEEEEEEDY